MKESAECRGKRRELAVGSWQLAVGSGQWAVGSGQLAVGSWQLAVGSGQLAVGSKRKIDPSLRVGMTKCTSLERGNGGYR